MKTKRIFVALICLMLMAATVLSSCDLAGGNGEETTAATTTAATTGSTTGAGTGATTAETTGAPTSETTAGTTAATTVAATTAATTKEVPNLEFVKPLPRYVNKPIARLDPPIEVNVFPGDPTYGDVTIDLNYQGWPTICKGEGDTIYAVSSLRIQHIDIFGAIGFCKSTDGGKTWTQMKVIIDTPLDDRDAGIVDLGDGHLMVTWFTHNASLYRGGGEYDSYRKQCTPEQLAAVDAKLDTLKTDSKDSSDTAMGFSYVAHSTDGGQTWGEPIPVPVSLPHGATLMQDGKSLICIGVPWNYKTVTEGNDPADGVFYVYTSTDGGYNWKYKSYLPFSQYGGYEAHIIQLTDGSFVASFRYDFANGTDNSGLRCYTATSKDGVKWTTPTRLESGLGGPPHLLQLKNGAVLLTYACRLKDQCDIRASISYDGGKTWGEEFIISRAAQQNTDHGYPSTVELDDGTLITAYYQRQGTADKYCSLLYTKWSLKEVPSAN